MKKAPETGAFELFHVMHAAFAGTALIKRRIACVEIAGVQLVLCQTHGFAEALEMNDLPLTQIADGILDIGVIGKAQDVVIGGSCLLFGGHILSKIGKGIGLGLEIACRERHTGCGCGINGCTVIDEILIESARLDLFGRQILRQLINNGGNNFEVSKLLCAYLMD